jgi:hypothetical protein
METTQESKSEIGKSTEKVEPSKSFASYLQGVARFLITMIIIAAFIVGGIYYVNETERLKEIPKKYFKKEIKKDIETAIKNGSDLNTPKHIFNTKEILSKGIAVPFLTKIENYYPESTSLSTILNDLLKDYYLNSTKDTLYLRHLQAIIAEHEEVNPFDKLASNQRFMFENIRHKLQEDYIIVREDLNRIADEMNNRNLLVEEYLSKSTLSYWLSIAAIGVTIFLSTFQIYLHLKRERKPGEKSFFKKFIDWFSSEDKEHKEPSA